MNSRRSPALSYDTFLFLGLIPVINVLNYYLTYPTISFTWRLPATFIIDTLEGYAAWYAARLIIERLDDVLPYHRNPLRRVLVQCAATSVAGVGVIVVLTEGVNALASDTPVPASFYTYAVFIFLIWFLVVNGIYVGLHYFGLYQHAESERMEAARIRAGGISVQSGRQTGQIPFAGVAGLVIDGDYVVLTTTDGVRYVLTQSLDTLEAELPGEWFFRLNRQVILHRDQVLGFGKLANGKLSVRHKPAPCLPDEIIVSRLKAPAFKRWFQAGAAL